MIVALELSDRRLVLLLLGRLDNLAIFVDKAAHCVLFPDLLDFLRVVLDFLSGFVDLRS